jgi:hypothetical protein
LPNDILHSFYDQSKQQADLMSNVCVLFDNFFNLRTPWQLRGCHGGWKQRQVKHGRLNAQDPLVHICALLLAIFIFNSLLIDGSQS